MNIHWEFLLKKRTLFIYSLLSLCLVWTIPLSAQEPDPKAEALELLESADDLLITIEQVRGYGPLGPIKKGIKTKDELEVLLRQKINEKQPIEKIEGESRLLVKWGLWLPDVSYLDFMIDLLTEQIAGFYDDDTQELYIMVGLERSLQEPVIVHEIFHAIQDQHFGIKLLQEGPDKEIEENADILMARAALIEGDAMAVMLDYSMGGGSFSEIPFFESLMRSTLQATVAGEGSQLFDKAPGFIKETMLFPYLQGILFLFYVKQKGGWEAVNALYHNPPSSTEQLLHPTRYDAGDWPVIIQFEIPPSWNVVQTVFNETIGEFSLYLLFKEHLKEKVDDGDFWKWTMGWGGDRTKGFIWPDDLMSIVMLSSWDTVEDATQARDGFFALVEHRFAGAEKEEHSHFLGNTTLYKAEQEWILIDLRGDGLLYMEGIPISARTGEQLFKDIEYIWNSHSRKVFIPTPTSSR